MHKFEEITKWAERYKYSLSFSDVSREFCISKEVVHRNLTRYKDVLDIEFKDDIQENLFKDKKRLCLPLTGCGEIKYIKDFYFRKDISKYKEQCKGCRQKYDRKWRQDNANRVQKYNKEYGKINRKEISKQEKEIRHSDICFYLKKRLRSRLLSAIKNNQKTGSAVRDLGCSIEYLKTYLEKQFVNGMTWENYGIWIILNP